MVIATVIGARLGHVLFYEPERYLSNPLDILKIWEGGLASHGAAVGILFALWLYARKKNPGQNYLQTLDRIVILVALTGALIRLGNFYNSEIIGKPTHNDNGVVFARNVTEVLKGDESIKKVSYVQRDTVSTEEGYKPVKILLEFAPSPHNTYESYSEYMEGRVNSLLCITNTYRNILVSRAILIINLVRMKLVITSPSLIPTRSPATLLNFMSQSHVSCFFWYYSGSGRNIKSTCLKADFSESS
jgi:prolipoprotein diacylglyceryltransferase